MNALSSKPIGFIGAGSWGTALACVAAHNDANCLIYTRNNSLADEINQTHSNLQYLPNIKLPSHIQATQSLAQLLSQCDVIILATPSQALAKILSQLKNQRRENHMLLLASKGLWQHQQLFLFKAIETHCPNQPFGILSGPSFAIEVAQQLPTAVVIASPQLVWAKQLAAVFHCDSFRVYLSEDVIGVSLGGVVKNCLAIACGIADGLGLGANAKSALITRGVKELRQLGKALGAKDATLLGLSGLGDIMLSCHDDLSRNRQFGLKIGQGLSASTASQQLNKTVEGLANIQALFKLTQHYQLESPIIENVFAVCEGNIEAKTAVSQLLERPMREETAPDD